MKIESKTKKIADNEVLKYKDFDGVLQKSALLKAASRLRFKWIGALSAVLFASTAAILYFSAPKKMEQPTTAQLLTIAMITPAAEQLTVANNSVIETANGSLLVIDENSFVDQNGKVIKGAVDLSFKEYHNPLDQIISGIPMTYDSAGVQYHFESAGMFEINAVDQNVKINPDAPLRVILNSQKNGTHYNLYAYNKEKKNWDFISKDNTPADHNRAKALKNLHDEFAAKTTSAQTECSAVQSFKTRIECTKPIVPKEEDQNKFRVSIEVDATEIPELASFQNLKFEVLPSTNFDARKANIIWDYATVKKEKEKYILSFFKGATHYEVEGVPVYGEKNYSVEKRKFDFGISAYNRRMDSITKALTEKTIVLEAAKKKTEEIIAIQVKEKPLYAVDEKVVGDAEHNVLRAFSVSKFGTYNCDCPQLLPTEQIVKACFKTKENNITLNQVYLVERNQKKMFTIYNSYFKTFPFNPKNSNLIISVDSIGQVYYFDNFSDIKTADNEYAFKMNPVNNGLRTVAEIKKYFNF